MTRDRMVERTRRTPKQSAPPAGSLHTCCSPPQSTHPDHMQRPDNSNVRAERLGVMFECAQVGQIVVRQG